MGYLPIDQPGADLLFQVISQRSKLKLGLELLAKAFRDHPEALKLYEQAREMIDPGRPPEETPKATPSVNGPVKGKVQKIKDNQG